MHRVKHIISLRYEQGYFERRIAQQVGVNRSTVSRTEARHRSAQKAFRLWPPWRYCSTSDNISSVVRFRCRIVVRVS